MRVGIMGAGAIAIQMAKAINGLKDVEAYAIASRSLDKANEFKNKYGFEKAYGSYEELVKDEFVDLVYIATPHNYHYPNAKLCLEYNKPSLVEKPFTVNIKQAEELFEIAREKNVLICEAMWTRFMPSRFLIEDIISKGTIGDIRQISGDLSFSLEDKERLVKKELAGGALLDVGIYPLSFALTYLGYEPIKVSGDCTYYKEEGIDANDSIFLKYPDSKSATLFASMQASSEKSGVICGDKGYICVKNINNPIDIKVYDTSDNLIEDVKIPEQINGYEYELLSCKEALDNKRIQTKEHKPENTLAILKIMDELRDKWGIKYPFE